MLWNDNNLSCNCVILSANKLHGPNKAFLVPDSCRETETFECI